jgi:hypothetical protein
VLVLAGAVAAVGGLLLDRAAAGGSEPGRALAVAGFVVLALGGVLWLLVPSLFGPKPGPARRFAQVAVPVGLIGVFCPAVAAVAATVVGGAASTPAATGPRSGPPDTLSPAQIAAHNAHGATSTTYDPRYPPPPVTATVPVQSPGVGGLEQQLARALARSTTTRAPAATTTTFPPSPDQVLADVLTAPGAPSVEEPLPAATRTVLGGELVVARAVADRYPTVADAERAGYRRVTGAEPGFGAQYARPEAMDTTFAIDQPEVLAYAGSDPASPIVGVGYFVYGTDEPTGFAGPNDRWQEHAGLCLGDGVVVGSAGTTEAACAARGGRLAPASAWTLRAWVVPGWESPDGVFSPAHPGLP